MYRKTVMSILIILIAVMSGCGSGRDIKTTTCKKKIKDVLDVTYEYDSDEDKVIKQKHKYYLFDISDEEWEHSIASLERYEGIKGVKYENDTDDKGNFITITIDYEKADFKDLYEVGLLLEEGKKEISLKDTLEDNEKYDFKCK